MTPDSTTSTNREDSSTLAEIERAEEVRYAKKLRGTVFRAGISSEQRKTLFEIHRAEHHLQTFAGLVKRIGTEGVSPSLGNKIPDYLAELFNYVHQAEESVLEYGGTWETIRAGVTRRKEDGRIRTV